MKHIALWIAVVCLALAAPAAFAPAQQQEEDVSSPKLRISWDDFKKLYDEKNVEIIDVRDQQSYKAGHIPGARSIPLNDVAKHVDELKKLKKPIVTYCA